VSSPAQIPAADLPVAPTLALPPDITVKPHWLYITRSVCFMVLCLAISISAMIFLKPPYRPSWLWMAAVGLAGFSVLLVIWKIIYRGFIRLRVDVNGVHLRQGILLKREQIIPLPRVDDVQVTQHLLQRILGMGDIHVISGSGSSEEIFGWAPHPHKINAVLVQWINVRYSQGGNYAVRN